MSEAFDRVAATRLLAKLRAKGLHDKILRVISSWLGRRVAHVLVEGAQSKEVELINMVYQGTVWGPALWNCFFEDARLALNADGFTEVVFADDCNCYKTFPRHISNRIILSELEACQSSLHRWGHANQATFDPSKECFCVLSNTDPYGASFRILGIEFDTKLQMGAAIHACARGKLEDANDCPHSSLLFRC